MAQCVLCNAPTALYYKGSALCTECDKKLAGDDRPRRKPRVIIAREPITEKAVAAASGN